jgi:hypothetical protein
MERLGHLVHTPRGSEEENKDAAQDLGILCLFLWSFEARGDWSELGNYQNVLKDLC